MNEVEPFLEFALTARSSAFSMRASASRVNRRPAREPLEFSAQKHQRPRGLLLGPLFTWCSRQVGDERKMAPAPGLEPGAKKVNGERERGSRETESASDLLDLSRIAKSGAKPTARQTLTLPQLALALAADRVGVLARDPSELPEVA